MFFRVFSMCFFRVFRARKQINTDVFKKHRVPEGSRKVRKGFPEAVPEGELNGHGDKRVFDNPHIYMAVSILYP